MNTSAGPHAPRALGYTPATRPCLAWALGGYVMRGQQMFRLDPNISQAAFVYAAGRGAYNPSPVFIAGQWYYCQPYGPDKVAIYYCTRTVPTPRFGGYGGQIGQAATGNANLANAQAQLAAAQLSLASAKSVQTLTAYQNAILQFTTAASSANAAGSDATAAAAGTATALAVAGEVARINAATQSVGGDMAAANVATSIATIQSLAQHAADQAQIAVNAAAFALADVNVVPGPPPPVSPPGTVIVSTTSAPASSMATVVTVGIIALVVGAGGFYLYERSKLPRRAHA